ncbi:zinc ribbon domain-containing protein [Butyrivibrio sp. MC2021]|uniref:zinc ribbon domain-containing protein n=1 Tax=Butyrivibrio sp. MC2021 TaxID=1408306 RepID=UPI000479111D|nr:zinc ribbon domain-containing protein [Butyrivibrio sp. MC2021]
MKCPKCGGLIKEKMNFCPFCGKKVFEQGLEYLVKITCLGQRDEERSAMKIFVDDDKLYEVKPGETICFAAKSGYHTFKFRHKIRNKTIQIQLLSNYIIKTYYNTLTGLIETNVTGIDDMEDPEAKAEFDDITLTDPVLTSENRKWEITSIDNDGPDYEIKASSGFKEGTLSLFAERCEFRSDNDMKIDVTEYKNVIKITKKLGSVAFECGGKIHKVYSIPKDTYNEVLAYLTNHIEAINADD